ncbi:uncharacterized protein EAF01_010446 [Botrytis porri]|uniref:uncharacterized protein n=1 Tax=Botrytis porri TaxID=87229 RepID=UPI0019008496|nr:uncharacterized protein EAF01_010446 [Botrytis porri]KAF7892366.1 hypothetical protein EAF01_010446 [Botrytis porri]
MCRLTKPITYYCDDDQASPPHIYLNPESEQWEGCLNHPNVDLRRRIFSAPERTCYDAPDQAPLANSICPDCFLKWGPERTAIINAHMKAILQRLDELCGLFNNPSNLRAEMRSTCHLVFDFAMYIEMPAPDETYTQYLSPPRGTGKNSTSSGTKYFDQLLHVDIPQWRKLADIIKCGNSEVKQKSLVEIFGQLARCQIEYRVLHTLRG